MGIDITEAKRRWLSVKQAEDFEWRLLLRDGPVNQPNAYEEPVRFAVIETADEVHVLPNPSVHVTSPDCWCEPVKDGQLPLFIHNEEE